jgi:hypothetical protein
MVLESNGYYGVHSAFLFLWVEWCLKSVIMVSERYYHGVRMVLGWCFSGVRTVLAWCQCGVGTMSRWRQGWCHQVLHVFAQLHDLTHARAGQGAGDGDQIQTLRCQIVFTLLLP